MAAGVSPLNPTLITSMASLMALKVTPEEPLTLTPVGTISLVPAPTQVLLVPSQPSRRASQPGFIPATGPWLSHSSSEEEYWYACAQIYYPHLSDIEKWCLAFYVRSLRYWAEYADIAEPYLLALQEMRMKMRRTVQEANCHSQEAVAVVKEEHRGQKEAPRTRCVSITADLVFPEQEMPWMMELLQGMGLLPASLASTQASSTSTVFG